MRLSFFSGERKILLIEVASLVNKVRLLTNENNANSVLSIWLLPKGFVVQLFYTWLFPLNLQKFHPRKPTINLNKFKCKVALATMNQSVMLKNSVLVLRWRSNVDSMTSNASCSMFIFLSKPKHPEMRIYQNKLKTFNHFRQLKAKLVLKLTPCRNKKNLTLGWKLTGVHFPTINFQAGLVFRNKSKVVKYTIWMLVKPPL